MCAWEGSNLRPQSYQDCVLPLNYTRIFFDFNTFMPKIKVGVLRGGPSAEYEISLLTGENVLKHLPKDKYEVHDLLWTKDGVLHQDGFPKHPPKIFKSVDVVFNALHGEYGEDGRVQQELELHGVPYTGSGVLASAVAMKKHLAKEIFLRHGLKTPRGTVVLKENDLEKNIQEITKIVPPFWAVKPNGRGSSVGTTIARSSPELLAGLIKAFSYDQKALVEEYIEGREATCGVLENFRGEKHYALPVIEIVPPDGRFFDYEVKYSGETREICPGRFDRETSQKLQTAAILAHQVLGCRHYSRSDFIISPKRGIFTLETNTLPGLTSQSLLPKAAEAVGLSFPKLLDHLVSLAFQH